MLGAAFRMIIETGQDFRPLPGFSRLCIPRAELSAKGRSDSLTKGLPNVRLPALERSSAAAAHGQPTTRKCASQCDSIVANLRIRTPPPAAPGNNGSVVICVSGLAAHRAPSRKIAQFPRAPAISRGPYHLPGFSQYRAMPMARRFPGHLHHRAVAPVSRTRGMLAPP
jgi:hypothetical protein